MPSSHNTGSEPIGSPQVGSGWARALPFHLHVGMSRHEGTRQRPATLSDRCEKCLQHVIQTALHNAVAPTATEIACLQIVNRNAILVERIQVRENRVGMALPCDLLILALSSIPGRRPTRGISARASGRTSTPAWRLIRANNLIGLLDQWGLVFSNRDNRRFTRACEMVANICMRKELRGKSIWKRVSIEQGEKIGSRFHNWGRCRRNLVHRHLPEGI